MYKVTVIDSLDEWAKISEGWNQLLSQSRSNTIFLTWEWLYTWAEYYMGTDRRLFILAVHKNNELIGVAPWCVRQFRYGFLAWRQIEFIGTPEAGSDYLDVFAKTGKENEVALRLYEYLFQETAPRWDCLLLRDMPAESPFLMHLLNKIEDVGKYVEIRKGNYCPVSILSRSPDRFLSGLSRNRREQWRRHLRVLKRVGEVERSKVIDFSGNGDDALQRFYSLYKGRWSNADKRFYQFLERLISRWYGNGWIQIDFLTVDKKDVAALLHLKYQETLYMYLMAVDRTFMPNISLGNLLVGLSMENAVKEQCAAYDFLRGSEEYKLHWANSGRRTLEIRLYQRRTTVFWALSVRCLKDIAKLAIR